MAEAPTGAPPKPDPAPSPAQPETSTEEKPGEGRVSTANDQVIVASTTPTGAHLSELLSSNFDVKTLDGDGDKFLATSYEGILPPPSLLKGYDEIVPGSAEKIIA